MLQPAHVLRVSPPRSICICTSLGFLVGGADAFMLLWLTSANGSESSRIAPCLRLRKEKVGFRSLTTGDVIRGGGGEEGGVTESLSCASEEKMVEVRRDGLDDAATEEARMARSRLSSVSSTTLAFSTQILFAVGASAPSQARRMDRA